MKLYEPFSILIGAFLLVSSFLVFETGRDYGKDNAVFWYDKYTPAVQAVVESVVEQKA